MKPANKKPARDKPGAGDVTISIADQTAKELDKILDMVTDGCVVPSYIAESKTKAKAALLALMYRENIAVVGPDIPHEHVDEDDWIVCNNCDRIIGDDSDYSSKCPCDIQNELRAEQRQAAAEQRAELYGRLHETIEHFQAGAISAEYYSAKYEEIASRLAELKQSLRKEQE